MPRRRLRRKGHPGRRCPARAGDDSRAHQSRSGGGQAAREASRQIAALKANARQFAANVRPISEEIMRAGATGHNAIAAKLNERNVRTARGGVWTDGRWGLFSALSAQAPSPPSRETQPAALSGYSGSSPKK